MAILRVPDAKWDRGERPLSVHAHADHDETVVIPTGSGTLYHGTDLAALTAAPFVAPVVLVFPGRRLHHVVMDPDAKASGTCFFTVPGTALVQFAEREPLNRCGKVTFADLAGRRAAAGRSPLRGPPDGEPDAGVDRRLRSETTVCPRVQPPFASSRTSSPTTATSSHSIPVGTASS